MSSDIDDISKEIVARSKEPVRIVLELHSNGNLQLTGPLNEPVTMLGILALATEMVHDIQRQRAKNKPKNIVVPVVKPRGMM